MSTLTYPEAMFVGLLQGVTELFPVSSLGHSVLIPAVIGGSWAQDLNVSKPESPYLAFIVGLHVATAAAMILIYWRDWARIIGGFFSSLRYRRVKTPSERLAWMIILATIPVGIAGLLLEHAFRVVFSKPVPAALFLTANGLILLWGERRQKAREAQPPVPAAAAASGATVPLDAQPGYPAPGSPAGYRPRHQGQPQQQPPWQEEPRQQQRSGDWPEQDNSSLTTPEKAIASDGRLSAMGFRRAVLIGAAQVLALLPGISRDGVVSVTGMRTGLTRQDAVRYSFLLSAPVILAAGVLKIPDLTGPLGAGIHGQVIVGSLLSFVGAYVSLRFLNKYFGESKSFRPFGIYCVVAGLFCLFFVLAFR